MRILLVAKPWRGGLAGYVHSALEGLFPGDVEWWPTRPLAPSARIGFRRNRREWYGRLQERLAGAEAEAMLFINHLAEFNELPRRSQQVLWLTDGPRPAPGDYACYGKVCLSDGGYAFEVGALTGERYSGEVSFGFSPDVHVPVEHRQRRRDLCFIANCDPKRDRYLEALFAAGVRPSVFGNYFFSHRLFWRYPGCFRPSVANTAMGRIYAGHRASLNLHAQVVRCGTNMRTFECAAYGIPQLIENRPGLERYFTPGEEIETFGDIEELQERLARLLAEPGRAEAMALRARRRAFAEHSYHHRCVALLEGILPSRLLRERLADLARPGGPLEVPC